MTAIARCHACGNPLRRAEHICPRCGEPVAPSERKLLTVAFADLTGYTALAASLDPEEVFTFLRPVMTDLRLTVEEFGGSVPQVLGDGFMAVFGVPAAHEDDAERAVRAALALVERVRAVNQDRAGGIHVPEIHAGINTGEVLVAASRESSGFAVVGDTVNVASRLSGLASGGQVMVGERTHRLTAHAIRYGPPLLRPVKGKPQPLTVYEALGPLTVTPTGKPAPPSATEFVDRRGALDRLGEELRRVADMGESRVLVVTGEAGLGKSRLAVEFTARLRRGVTVLWGRSYPYGQHLPLTALVEALRERAGEGDEGDETGERGAPSRLARRLGRTRNEVRTLTADLRLLFGLEARPPATEGEPGREISRAARTVLEAAAGRGPAVLVLDDLHWADPELVEFLAGAHRDPLTAPVLVLALSRPEPPGPPLPVLELDQLGPAEMREMVHLVLGPGVPDTLAERLAVRSGGNPLFLEESARMVVESGALVPEGDGWRLADPAKVDDVPATLRLLIAARVDALSAIDKRTLQNASVSGRVTWDRLLRHLVPGGRPEAALRRLQARDLLRMTPDSLLSGAAQYEFKHALIRDVAYHSLARADRVSAHVAVARWLERQGPRLSVDPIADLAHHYEQAWFLGQSRTGPPPDPQIGRMAVEYLAKWADQVVGLEPRLGESLCARALAIAIGDEVAIDPTVVAGLRMGRAEALLDLLRLEEAAAEAERALPGSTGTLRARVLVVQGRVLSDLGDVAAARAPLEEARAVFDAAGDRSAEAWLLYRLGETWRFDDFPRLVAMWRRSNDLFRDVGTRWERALAAQRLAYALSVSGGEAFRQSFEEAHGLLDAGPDTLARASLIRTWAYHAYYAGDLEEAIRAAREAQPLAREAGDRWVEIDALLLEAMASGAARPPSVSEPLVREIFAFADAAGARHLRALAQLAGVRPALRSGRRSVAAARLRSARRTLTDMDARAELAEVELMESALALERGTWDRVARSAASAESRAGQSGWSLLCHQAAVHRGRALLGAGDLEVAFAELRAAADAARSSGAGGTGELAAACATQARLLLGRPARVSGRSIGVESHAVGLENSALAAVAAAQPERAAERFAAAVEIWQELGTTVWLARALGWQAAALRRAARARPARALAERAEQALTTLASPKRFWPGIVEPPLPGVPRPTRMPARARGRSSA